MYPHLVLSLVLAAAPFTQAAPATQKPRRATTARGRPPRAKGVRTVEIVGTEDMKFSLATITAKPGEQLRVRLVVKGAMPKIAMAHNFVLLEQGRQGGRLRDRRDERARTDFIPADKKADVLAHTGAGGRRRDGRGHLQGPGRRGRLSVPVLVPRPLPGRHEGHARRQVGSRRGSRVQEVQRSRFQFRVLSSEPVEPVNL